MLAEKKGLSNQQKLTSRTQSKVGEEAQHSSAMEMQSQWSKLKQIMGSTYNFWVPREVVKFGKQTGSEFLSLSGEAEQAFRPPSRL